jgi:hypothetical protein
MSTDEELKQYKLAPLFYTVEGILLPVSGLQST